MDSTGYPPSSGSYSGLLPWPGGVCWALLRPTCEIFAVPSGAPEVAAHSAQWNGGYSLSLFPYFHEADPCILGVWLATLCGMGFHWHCDYSPTGIELSGGVLGVQPPSSFFNPPAYSQKLPWGVRLNPTEQRSVTQCILFSACSQRFRTRVSFRMIRSSDATTVL